MSTEEERARWRRLSKARREKVNAGKPVVVKPPSSDKRKHVPVSHPPQPCLSCGGEFVPKRTDHLFCSSRCSDRHRQGWRVPGTSPEYCEYCGAELAPWYHGIGRPRGFCDRKHSKLYRLAQRTPEEVEAQRSKDRAKYHAKPKKSAAPVYRAPVTLDQAPKPAAVPVAPRAAEPGKKRNRGFITSEESASATVGARRGETEACRRLIVSIYAKASESVREELRWRNADIDFSAHDAQVGA